MLSLLIGHCHLMCISHVWFMRDSDVCHHASYIYFFVCVSDFGERGQFVYLHILSFVFLACFCKCIYILFMQTEGKILLLP